MHNFLSLDFSWLIHRCNVVSGRNETTFRVPAKTGGELAFDEGSEGLNFGNGYNRLREVLSMQKGVCRKRGLLR